jgi:hypothetical protein
MTPLVALVNTTTTLDGMMLLSKVLAHDVGVWDLVNLPVSKGLAFGFQILGVDWSRVMECIGT